MRGFLYSHGRRVFAASAVLGLVFSACGGGNDGTADAPGQTSEVAGAPDTQDDGAAPPDGANCVDEVTLASVWPMTGPFEFAGKASLVGAQLAADEINEAGGIAALCGATVSLASYDAGATAEGAASAVEAVLSDHPDVPVILGSWLSSLTLSATEVSEREGIPWLSDSFADEVTERSGFTHVFSVAPPSSLIKDLLLESVKEGFELSGRSMETVAVVGDNSAAAVALQEALIADFKANGQKLAVTEQWAPGLSDASGVAAKIIAADVDAVFLISFGFADVQLVVSELESRGLDAPIIQNGGQGLLPAWQDLGDSIVGMTTFVTANPVNGGEEIADRLAAAAGEEYARQDHLVGYHLVQVAAAALEEAGTVDRETINEVLHSTTFTQPGVVDAVASDGVSFDESGRIAEPFGVLAQWQRVDGELRPCTIWPTEFKVCDPAWESADS